MFHPKGPSVFELIRQGLSSTERGYDLLATKFDYTPFRTPDVILREVERHLEALGPIRSALDICCGTGAAMEMLRPHCRERLVGLDISEGMLNVARRRVPNAPGTAALEFVRADALHMPFESEFDLAVCFGAFGHIRRRDETRFVQQVARSLKPGGRFVFVTTEMPPLWSATYWVCRAFNAVMRLRNSLVHPQFTMYYLTFLLPPAQRLLEKHGFNVEVKKPFTGWFARRRLVVATLVAHELIKYESLPRQTAMIPELAAVGCITPATHSPAFSDLEAQPT